MNFMKMTSQKIFAVASLFAFTILLGSCSGDHHENEIKQEAPIAVTVAVAGNQVNNVIQASGQIESRESAVISTRIMGFITSIKVKAGDKVQKGQLLATISNGDILAKRAQAQAMITEAEAALKDAQKDYERYEALYKQQSASTKEFENVTLHYNGVKAKVEAARQMKNEANAMLAYTNLVAPFSGVVTQTMADEGSMANPGMPILVVEQNGVFQVTASVTESDIDKVKERADAEVIIKSNGRSIKGKVQEVSPSSQFSGGQYAIKVSIPESERNGLYSGMYVNVCIQSKAKDQSSEGITLVPISALIYRDQLVGLYTISESKTAILRWVRLGKAHGDQTEILSGLSVNENFILRAEGKLYNGASVQVK
jgi:RND family efflux transporter MFP subunit